MNKTLLVIGKFLIVLSFLWPIPCGYIVPFLGWIGELQPEIIGSLLPNMGGWYHEWVVLNTWGKYMGYWWPLLIPLTIGCVLCYISKYKCVNSSSDLESQISPFVFLFRLIKWAVYVIVGFFLLTLVVLGIYYTLFTKYITTIVPIGASVAILGFLIFVGIKFYRHNKDE